MADANVTTPYSGAAKLINRTAIPTWMNAYDAQRIASYGLYENIYWTNPDTFKLVQRGAEANPLYMPSGRIIVNTMDRYVGVDMAPIMDPAFGTPDEQAVALVAMTDFLKRERFGSQYESNKLYGIMRGDWCFYITANAAKAQGSRLTLRGIDPAMVFPINPANDVDRVIGYDLVEQITVGDNLRIKRTRYLKSDHPDHPSDGIAPGGPISYQVDTLELENWEDPEEAKYVAGPEDVPIVLMPTNITQLPVYHIKNFEEPGNPFGSSEMRGLERVMAGVNQAITDEELALALEGLGMYKSEKGNPIDSNGNPTTWQLGPGRVVHDGSFERVNGVNTVGPFQEHLAYLHSQMDQVSGTSDVAKGVVDVTVAESGIALKLRMGPILGASKKKDVTVKEVLNQMFYDLRDWFSAYEGVNMTNVRFEVMFGQKLPEDTKARFDQLFQMYTADPPLITAAYFRDACREMGFEIPIDITGEAIAAERSQMVEAMDPYGTRVDEEIAGAGGDEPEAGAGDGVE